MNNAKVAEWLREAAGCIRESGEDYSQFLKWHNTRDELAKIADKMLEHFQVEAMTCDGCDKWAPKEKREYGQCESDKVRVSMGSIIFPGPKFGCIHWEEKQ